MSNVAKLKKQAAEFELKKQFDKALGGLRQASRSRSTRTPTSSTSALFNRVGDLLRSARATSPTPSTTTSRRSTGTPTAASSTTPSRSATRSSATRPVARSIYYKLGKISAQKGFKNDAKVNFLEYADRMQKAGKVDEAFRALKEFADLCPDQDEIRLMLADQLVEAERKAEAIEQLQMLHERLRRRRARARGARRRRSDARDRSARGAANEPVAGQSQERRSSIFIDLDEPTFSASEPGGIPLVPPPRIRRASSRFSATPIRPTLRHP